MNTTEQFVTDGGLETDLIYNRGFDLPDFAAFPLVEDDRGRQVMTEYYDEYAAIAARAGVGLRLESPTWRANPDWAAGLGYDATRLAAVNRASIDFVRSVGERWTDRVGAIEVSGQIGPRGDGYRPGAAVDPDEAAEYHRPQIAAFAEAGADVATALTLTDTGEALGVVAAARDVGIPVAISFTVETDGKLPTGKSLMEAIAVVDADGGPDYFFVNCAHPEHVERGLGHRRLLAGPGARPAGQRPTRSHEELDAMTELDAGDPTLLATAHARLERSLPGVRVIGGCCGTDARHVAALWRDRSRAAAV